MFVKRVGKLASDKHSSLLRKFLTYGPKKFFNLDTRKPKKAEDMLMFKIDHASKESIEASATPDDVTETGSLQPPVHGLRESRSNPMLIELGQTKELEIIEEQNEQVTIS